MKKMIAVLIVMIVAMFVLTGCTITIEKVVHEPQITTEVSK
jgi:outer membrane biogenesis lipoprotein LolB